MVALIENGYAHALLAGNALANHDLEAAIFRTGLGQDIYTQSPVFQGHYHHLVVINMAAAAVSIGALMEKKAIGDGEIHACLGKKSRWCLRVPSEMTVRFRE
jgi:hypothetical protein